MKIAVIGAGIFGSTAAIKLAQIGHQVDLFERYGDILQAASGINQYRFHRGYHYPRSPETAASAMAAEPLFRRDYGAALIDGAKHYYAIAKVGSLVTGQEFLDFCDHCGLEYELTTHNLINPDSVSVIVKAQEVLIDPIKLRQLVRTQLDRSGVNLLLNQLAGASVIDRYDLVVNATYANLNFILERYPEAKRDYQFELCEKVVLRLPASFANQSLVVLDGPFMCLDPYNDSGYHVMGNVVHAIHASNVGLSPTIPPEFNDFLNKGIIKNPPLTNIKKFIDSATDFIPTIETAEHIGSMYTIRTVLPNLDKTDERLTTVYRVNDKIINIFSGKIGNSVQAAEHLVRLL